VSSETVVTTTQQKYATPGWTAARFARHLERALSDLEITSAQYRLLVQLAQGADASGSLAKKLAVSPPSVTTVVDGLVQRGAVERTPSELDRRRISLALTDSGRELLARAESAVSAWFNAIVETLDDPAAARTALEALTIWSEALDRYSAQRSARVEAQRSARGETVPDNS
jgi:DNA-binding MarR family transcriptional regulator